MATRQFATHNPAPVYLDLFEPDLIYYAQPGVHYDDRVLVVDYDMWHLKAAQPPRWQCSDLKGVRGEFRAIVLNLPRFIPMMQYKEDFAAASTLSFPSGEAAIIAPPRSGAKRLKGMLESCFEHVEVTHRRPHVYYCRQPKNTSYEIELNAITYMDEPSGKELHFSTRQGVFSSKNIDEGSSLLMDCARIEHGQAVLDFCCGYGFLGVVAANRGGQVTMVDSDYRALSLVKVNLKRNGLNGRSVLAIDLHDFEDSVFDVVLLNPPTHAGKESLLSIFGEVTRTCKRSGCVYVVTREMLNYEKLMGEFGASSLLSKEKGYKVWKVTPD